MHLNAALATTDLHAKGLRWLHDSCDEKVLIMASDVGLAFRAKRLGMASTVGCGWRRAHV
jgi:hypothetical protein